MQNQFLLLANRWCIVINSNILSLMAILKHPLLVSLAGCKHMKNFDQLPVNEFNSFPLYYKGKQIN